MTNDCMEDRYERFLSRRFGVVNHFLYANPGGSAEQRRGRRAPGRNSCGEALDAEYMV